VTVNIIIEYVALVLNSVINRINKILEFSDNGRAMFLHLLF